MFQRIPQFLKFHCTFYKDLCGGADIGLLLLGCDPLLDDGDGALQAGDGLIELGVVAESNPELVVSFRYTPGILGELCPLLETGLEVLDGLLVVLALNADLAEAAQGTAELLKHRELLLLLGVSDQLGVDDLGRLKHLPGKLQVGWLLLILLLIGTFFLLVRGLYGFVTNFISGLDLLVLLHSFVLAALSLFGLFSFLLLSLSFLLSFTSLTCEILLFLFSLFFHLLELVNVLLQGIGDLLGNFRLLLVGEFRWILELRGVGFGFLLRDTLKSIAKNARLHPGELKERFAIVIVDLGAFLGSLSKLLGQKLTSLGKVGNSLGYVVDKKVPLADGEKVVGLLLDLLRSLSLDRRSLLSGRSLLDVILSG